MCRACSKKDGNQPSRILNEGKNRKLADGKSKAGIGIDQRFELDFNLWHGMVKIEALLGSGE